MDQEQLVVASVFARADIVLALCVTHPRLTPEEIPECLVAAAGDLAAEHSARRLRVVVFQPHCAHRFLEVRLDVLHREQRVAGSAVTDADLLRMFEEAVAENELVVAYPIEFAARGLQ